MDSAKGIKKAGKVLITSISGVVLLVLIACVAFDIYVRVEFRKEVRQLREKGEPITLGDFARETISDEQNAASVYREILPEIDAYGDKWKQVQGVSCSYNDPDEWAVEQREYISYTLAKHDDLLDFAHEASLKPYCNFYPGYTTAQPDDSLLLKFASLSHLLSLKSALDKDDGRVEEAAGRIADGFAVAEAVGTVGSSLSFMISIACDEIMLNRLESLLVDMEMSQQGYQRLYEALRKHRETSADLVTGLQGERCDSITYFKRPSRSPYLLEQYMKQWPFAVFVKSWHLRDLRVKNDAVEIAKKPYWEIADRNTGPYRGFLIKKAERDARLMSAELAVAVYIYKCRNGEYPETLDALVPSIVKELPSDPFTGKDFIYQREGKQFVVYSHGKNARDDGGNWEPSGDDIAWRSGKWAGTFLTAGYRNSSI